jgi:hypothetical protein
MADFDVQAIGRCTDLSKINFQPFRQLMGILARKSTVYQAPLYFFLKLLIDLR